MLTHIMVASGQAVAQTRIISAKASTEGDKWTTRIQVVFQLVGRALLNWGTTATDSQRMGEPILPG